MGPRVSLNALEERKLIFLCWELDCDFLVVQHIAVSQPLFVPHLDEEERR
jgi:hypothetical protein